MVYALTRLAPVPLPSDLAKNIFMIVDMALRLLPMVTISYQVSPRRRLPPQAACRPSVFTISLTLDWTASTIRIYPTACYDGMRFE